MSLIHWWPLNGDTKDYGTNPKPGSLVGTASVTATGKLGYALSAGDGTKITAGVNVPNCNLIQELASGEYSFACWFKLHGTHVNYNGTIMSSGNWNDDAWAVGVSQDNTKIDVFNNGYNQYLTLSTPLELEKWYHLASVQNGETNYVFLNGVLVGQKASTALYRSSATNLCIGRETYASGHFSFNGDICDVRVYDHALSTAEIKELSKALAIHYSFNDICMEDTSNLVTGLTAGGRTTYNSTEKSITTAGENSDTYFYINTSSALVEGETYTLQCMAENIEADKYFTFGVGAQASGNPQFKIQNGYNELTFVGTANTATTKILLDDSARTGWERKAKFYNFQIEKRDHATPYISTSRTSTKPFNETGGTQPGYATAITLTTDSGNGSLSWKNNNGYITFPARGDASHGATASMWLKVSGDIATQAWVAFADANSQLGFGPYTSSGSNAYGVIASTSNTNKRRASNLSSLWKNNEWNHVVVSMDSSNTVNRCFINGTEVNYGAADNWTHGTYTAIGARYSSSSYSRFYPGLMSDFRLYHTCLSDQDILELYKTKGYISNLGDMNSTEFIEGKSQAQVTKKNTFENKTINETVGNKYMFLEYIQSTGTQYIDTTYVSTSTDFAYELDMAWTGTTVGNFYSFMGYMASGSTPRAAIHMYSGTLMFGANATTNSTVAPVSGERFLYKGVFKSGDQRLYKNNVEIASNETTFTNSSNTLSAYIGARNCPSGKNIATIKLYEAKIYEGNQVVRHYIPARRSSDNALGVYEVYTNTFLTNAGTGTFTAGPTLVSNKAQISSTHSLGARSFIEN